MTIATICRAFTMFQALGYTTYTHCLTECVLTGLFQSSISTWGNAREIGQLAHISEEEQKLTLLIQHHSHIMLTSKHDSHTCPYKGGETHASFLHWPLQPGCHVCTWDTFGSKARNKAVRPAKETKDHSESLRLENQHLKSPLPAFGNDRWKEKGQDHWALFVGKRAGDKWTQDYTEPNPNGSLPVALVRHSALTWSCKGTQKIGTPSQSPGPPWDW